MNELTVEILKQIRDGVVVVGERVDRLGERVDHLETSLTERIDGVGERLDGTNQRLDRVEQGLLDLGTFMRQIARDQSRHERFHHQHVDLLEKDVDDLKARVTKLEKKRDD